MKLRTLLLLLSVLAVVGALAWGAIRVVRATTAATALELPTTKVKQGRVILTVRARGELQGGNSEMLTAPMIGGGDMAITSLREPGELVSPGDLVVQFDTDRKSTRLHSSHLVISHAVFCLKNRKRPLQRDPPRLSESEPGRQRDSWTHP